MGKLVSRVELGVAAVVQALEVQVLVVGQLRMDAHHRGHAHIGAHRRDAAELHAQIGKAAVGIHVALAQTQPAQVVAPQDGLQLVDDLHQGLDLAGGLLVTAAESEIGELQDLAKRVLDHVELLQGGAGKAGAVLLHAGGDVRDAHGMVAQTLELRGDLEVLVEDGDVLLQLQVGQQLHRVAAAAVGEMVDILLLCQKLLVELLVILFQQEEGLLDVVAGCAEQAQQQLIAAVQRQGRRVEEAGVQAFQLVPVFFLVGGAAVVLHDAAAQLLVDGQQGEEAERAAEIEDGVGVGDHAGVGRALPQPVQQAQAVHDGDADEHQHRFAQVEEDVHDAHPLGLRLCADGADDGGGDAVAQVDAHDHGVDGLEGQHAG